jgi:hypothetical protein
MEWMADPKSAMNGSGPDDGTLGLRQTGKLPNRRPDRLWGGPGGGANCAICTIPVERHQLEFELEFTRNGEGAGVNKYHVHVRCLAAWEHTLAASVGATSLMPPRAVLPDQTARRLVP